LYPVEESSFQLKVTTKNFSLPARIALGEAEVFDDTGAGIGAGEFVRILNDIEDESEAASFSWMLVINEVLGLRVQLQSLPVASTL
jgi:hypothetical protein